MAKISTAVLSALDRSELHGNTLTLPGQLERKLYTDVAKVIELAGGKWNRKAGCHLFPGDAAEAIEPVLLTGEIQNTKKDFGQFNTPDDIADMAAALLDLGPGMKLLEPSVGTGALVRAALRRQPDLHVYGYEIDPRLHAGLMEANPPIWSYGGCDCADFLTICPSPVFDRILMNPPFSGQADIKHVTHAMGFLKPGGRIVAIMSNGVQFRENRATVAFLHLLHRSNGTICALPENAFRESGTGVNTVLVTMTKQGESDG